MDKFLRVYICLIVLYALAVLFIDRHFLWRSYRSDSYNTRTYHRGIGEVGLISGLIMTSLYCILHIQGQHPIRLEQQILYIVLIIFVIFTTIEGIIYGIRGAVVMMFVILVVIEILLIIGIIIFLIMLF